MILPERDWLNYSYFLHTLRAGKLCKAPSVLEPEELHHAHQDFYPTFCRYSHPFEQHVCLLTKFTAQPLKAKFYLDWNEASAENNMETKTCQITHFPVSDQILLRKTLRCCLLILHKQSPHTAICRTSVSSS